MAGLELRDVSKVYPGGVSAVEGANLTISDGEFIVLVGPSGCGKSTILRMVAGLERITKGEILIGGECVNGLEPGAYQIAPEASITQGVSGVSGISVLPEEVSVVIELLPEVTAEATEPPTSSGLEAPPANSWKMAR